MSSTHEFKDLTKFPCDVINKHLRIYEVYQKDL